MIKKFFELESNLRQKDKYSETKDYVIRTEMKYDKKFTINIIKIYLNDDKIKIIKENLTIEEAIKYIDFYLNIINDYKNTNEYKSTKDEIEDMLQTSYDRKYKIGIE